MVHWIVGVLCDWPALMTNWFWFYGTQLKTVPLLNKVFKNRMSSVIKVAYSCLVLLVGMFGVKVLCKNKSESS